MQRFEENRKSKVEKKKHRVMIEKLGKVKGKVRRKKV